MIKAHAFEDFWHRLRSQGWLPVLVGVVFLMVMIGSSALVTTRTQLAVGVVGVCAFLILRNFSENLTGRVIFLTIAAFLSTDYFYWRTFTTLTYHDLLSFSAAVALYLAELYGFSVYLLSLFVNVDPLDRKPVPLPDTDAGHPSVDVMIPTYNEPLDLLEVTLISAMQMRYPKEKLEVFMLDDGGTDQRCEAEDEEKSAAARQRRRDLQDLCARHGARYLTRHRNVHAKAGNINNGLQHSSGDLVVIFDADHAPTQDFLENTVGWFLRDPKMFLVQTPHFFVNPDPIEKNLETFQQMPGENEMFYRVIQRGLDHWNSAFFCGSAALIRRKYLMEIGGISGETITEDAETALTLHSRGYNSAYIGIPMIAGLSPETLGGFIGQRIRWAQGMVQIFLLKNPLLIPGLTIPQRLCYFSSCFFWFFAYARLVFVLAPLCFLLFGLKIYDANFVDFSAYAIPHLLAVFLVSDFLFGRVRWSFVSELYELMQSVYTLPAIFKVFLNPRAPKFNVTAKGETLDRDFISPLARPFYVFLALNAVALGFGVFKLFTIPAERFPTSITMCWAAFNLFILLAAMGVLLERRQRRSTPRMPIQEPLKVIVVGKLYAGTADDLSLGGLSVTMDAAFESVLTPNSDVHLAPVSAAAANQPPFHVRVCNIRSQGATMKVGLQFRHKSMDEMRRKIGWVNGSSGRWTEFQNSRERRLGVTRSAIFLARLGIHYSIQHFAQIMLSSNKKSKVAAFEPAAQKS